MSDVEHAGWAVGGPGSRLRRHRSPLLGLVALLLLAGGLAATAWGIVRLATEAGPADERILARGTVAGLDGPATPAAEFDAAGGGPVTVWLRLGGLSNVRETIVAGTECELGGTQIRGSRQGASVETDGHATIGELTAAAGPNAVTCRHVPFGRRRTRGRLRDEHPFVVERGTPGDGLGGMWLLFPGIAALGLGVLAGARWRAGTLKPA
jgi:hypothetical protein